jgi:signal-transduction protein with cAMP-binding, CBS, and nucleotidyltransferase domain
MFLIIEGSVDILTPGGKDVSHKLHKGECFGELALVNKIRRTVSVVASNYCVLYVLKKEDFDKIIEHH